MLVYAFSAAQVQAQFVFDATADFSITNGNPNGVWSYGAKDYSDTEPTGAFSLLPTAYEDATYGPGFSGPTGQVWINNTSFNAFGIPPGGISLNGDQGGTSTVRWTAPQAGGVEVVGSFGIGDFGIGYRGVYVNNTREWSLGWGEAGDFRFTKSVAAGDTIDFLIWGGSCCGGNTPLKATITLYSEPNQPPTIRSQPIGQTNYVGEAVRLSVLATGTWPLSYQWQKDGLDLIGVTNSALVSTSATMAATGDYTVIVSNDFGSLTSAVARVTITERPWPYVEEFQGSVGREWSHRQTDVTPAGNRRFLGQFGNDTVNLTLQGLPAHQEVTVSFDLFVIQSWDADGGGGGPDVWDLSVASGPTLLHTTFSNTNPDNPNQAYPGSFPGQVHPARTGAMENNSLGYSLYGDAVYHLTFTFPHTADAVTLNFSGIGVQDIGDESWGLDNVRVELSPDPTNAMSNVRTTLAPTYASPLPATNSIYRVATSGTCAAALCGDGSVQWLDLKDRARPLLLGTWEPFLMPYDVAAAGNLVYIASWELDFLSTVEIVDFSDPSKPVLRGYYDTPGYAQDVAVVGSRAYVADGEGGLHILDVSDPVFPQRLGGFDTKGSVDSVQVSGRYAYVTVGNWVLILDVSDPGNPRRAGVYEAPGGIQSMKAIGSKLYLAQATGELEILDVSDPGNIKLLGSYRSYGTEAIAVAGRFAYLAGSGGVRVLDVNDPAKVTWLAGAWNIPAQDLSLMGNYAVVAGGDKGLAIYELQQSIYPPLNPPVIAGGMMTMTWPFLEGARLQMATNLAKPFWQDIPGSEGTNTVSLPMTEAAVFFRLLKP